MRRWWYWSLGERIDTGKIRITTRGVQPDYITSPKMVDKQSLEDSVRSNILYEQRALVWREPDRLGREDSMDMI